MHSWSTDDVPEHERFAIWREWRASHIFGLTTDVEHDARHEFRASVKSRMIGKAALVELRASPYRAHRSSQDIARVRSDSLCIYQQVAGPCWSVRDGRNPAYVAPRSNIAFGYSDLPYETVPMSGEAFHSRLVKIPLTPESDGAARRADMVPRVLRPTAGLNALFASYAQSFFDNIAHLEGRAAETAVDVLGRLALLAYAQDAPIDDIETARETVAAAKLHLAHAYIMAHLHRPDLSPATVSRALGLSLRQLHRLFEPTGTTFARYVLSKRVERVAALLAETAGRSVLDAAFACGFGGSSVFYRAFKSQYGMSPRTYREVRLKNE